MEKETAGGVREFGGGRSARVSEGVELECVRSYVLRMDPEH
jgi:hypothetical protein